MKESWQGGSLECDGSTWWFRYREKDAQGKVTRPRKRLGTVEEFPTKAKAKRALQAKMIEVNECIQVTRFNDLADVFKAKALSDRPGSQRLYKTFIRRFSGSFGSKRLDWLCTPQGISAMEDWFINLAYEDNESKLLAKSTKQTMKGILHCMFEKAQKWGYLGLTMRNPVEFIQIRQKYQGKRKRVILTIDQYQALLDDPKLAYHVKVMIQVAAYTGFRRSEILGLQWSDIDFRGLRINVKRGCVGKHLDSPKSVLSGGSYPLHPDLVPVLRKWKTDVPVTGDWVFGNPMTQMPFNGDSLQAYHLAPAGERIGIECLDDQMGLGFHHFRHFRRALGKSLSPESQKKLMRHAKLSTTFDVYGNDDDRAEEIRADNLQLGDRLRRINGPKLAQG